MRLPALPFVGGTVRSARDTAVLVVLLPGRAIDLLGQVEALLAKVDRVADEASETVAAAGQVVHAAGAISDSAQQLLGLYDPVARKAAPMLTHFVDELSDEEIRAAIHMVDQLPALTEAVVSDIMPILGTLDRVGPDIHGLLDVAKDVREAVIGIPGFGFFRKRGEHKVDPEYQPERRAEQ